MIKSTLSQFEGQIKQKPPAFSAVHVKGRRAYDLARAGVVVDLPERIVSVYKIELIDYTWPHLQLRIDCGRGTYIRSLARDIGQALNVGGHLVQLRRTRVGAFAIENAKLLKDITVENIQSCLQQVPVNGQRASD
jgi:tRNA pseudouridine55 synthase